MMIGHFGWFELKPSMAAGKQEMQNSNFLSNLLLLCALRLPGAVVHAMQGKVLRDQRLMPRMHRDRLTFLAGKDYDLCASAAKQGFRAFLMEVII